MVLKRLLDKRFIKKNVHVPVEELISRAKTIRQVNEDLVICPRPTGYNWLGIYNATQGLFPGNVLALPQYYSSPVYSEKELKQIGEELKSLSFRNIIFSGFLPYFEHIIEGAGSQSKTGVIYHGYLSELSSSSLQASAFNNLIGLAVKGRIHKIAFNKKGMSETLGKILNIRSHHILLKTPVSGIPTAIEKYRDGKKHIGVMVNNHFRKNLHNQVAGALMVGNSVLHVSDIENVVLFNQENRIIRHGTNLDHTEFVNLLARNDLNMYVTYSESWGLVATESMSRGVPCLVADNSGIMDYDEELAKFLVVREFDNSAAIARQAEIVLQNRDWISGRCENYIHVLNSKAEEQLKAFMDA